MSDPSLAALADLVRRLRAPDGCPWDREQTLADVRAYLLEEAHEVAAAIDAGNLEQIEGELGDLLFQLVFVAELTAERGGADLETIASVVRDKMVERHPHVFGNETLTTADQVARAWEARKARRKGKAESILDGVPPSLPSLLAAFRMTQKAAGVGFDWPDVSGVLDKIEEEIGELRQALATQTAGSGPRAPDSASEVVEEVGDLLFAVANLARHLGVDPEGALARTNLKFRRRFASIEGQLARRGLSLDAADTAVLEELWERAKRREPGRG
jgi:MazG family protein